MSIESVILSNHLIFCHSLLLLSSKFPSIKVFSFLFFLYFLLFFFYFTILAMCWFFASVGQRIGASTSVNILFFLKWYSFFMKCHIGLCSENLIWNKNAFSGLKNATSSHLYIKCMFVDLYETIILLGLISQSCDFYILQTWRTCSLSSSGNPNQIVVMGKSVWY